MRLILLFLPFFLLAEVLDVGDCITPAKLHDQFENSYEIGSESTWVITWDKMTTRHANSYFASDPSMLEQNLTRLIVDVSQTPSGIMTLFVMPRMRSYDHTILLSYDEAYNRKLPYKEGHVTVLFLEGGMIQSIEYAADETMLEALLSEH